MTISTTGRVSAFISAPAPAPPSPKLHVILNKHFTHSSNLQIISIIYSKSHHPLKTNIPLLSSTSSAPFVEEEEDQEDGNVSLSPPPSPPPSGDSDELLQSETPALEQGSADLSSGRGCKTCGREEIEGGCNGEGRIQGGIANVPGFGWWPIKAYRPCPAYLATGGRYKRRGQSMDEVASGGIGRRVDDDKTSKGKQGPRKFKQ